MAKKIIFTREHALEASWIQKLEEHHFEVHHLPLISCQPNPLPEAIEKVLPRADWVFFTSAVAADFFSPYLTSHYRLASIGIQTSATVKRLGYEVDFEAASHYATDFAREWLVLELPPQCILLPQSSLSNPIIAQTLREHGHEVWAWPLYETRVNPAGQEQLATYLAAEDVIWTFASPSAWQSFYAGRPVLPASHRIAVIGTTTAQAVTAAGYEVDYMPQTPAVGQMIDEILRKEAEANEIYETPPAEKDGPDPAAGQRDSLVGR